MGAGWKHGPARGGPASGAGRGGPARGGAARSHSEDKNGPGWGGDAKGAGKSRFDEMTPEQLEAVRALARDPKHAEAKAALREVVLTAIMEVATEGQNEGARVTAALGLAKKIGLQDEPTETRVSGTDGGPVVLRVVTGVPRASDAA